MAGNARKIMYWQAPSFMAPPEIRMGWVEEQIEEGEGWLQGQRVWKQINENFRVFNGVFQDKTKSILITNEIKYNLRKFSETLSDMREIGTLGSDVQAYKSYAEMENRMMKAVYLESDFTLQVRRVIQYASLMGRGYLWPKCKTTNYGFGERRIIFEPKGLMDVIPVQVPSTNDAQDAYSVTIFEYMPVAEAHGRFPKFQADLVPVDRMKNFSRVSSRRIDHAERFNYGEEHRNFGVLNCEIRYTFVRDVSVNTTGQTIPMGEPGTTWFYEVPTVGSEIFAGYRGGVPFTKKAEAQDCLIYPQLRLIISSRGMSTPLYDGPAFDWHGMMPCVQYEVDDYPWDAVGRSLVGDVGTIQQVIRKMERKMEQVVGTSLNPPMGYDRTQTGGPKIENFDLFEEDVRAGLDGNPKEVLQSLLPESVHVSQVHFDFLQYLKACMGKQLGIEDVANLQALKANITADAADKLLEQIGPVAKGIASNVERANAKVANQLKYMIPQWFDSKRIISTIGPDNVTPEVFDFDPHSMIPSHMEDEYVAGTLPMTHSKYPLLKRAKKFAESIRLTSVPSTLLKVTQMQEQLKYLQLQRGGFPISNSTVAKKLDIENYGEVKGDTEREKWFNEKLEDLKLQAIAQLQAMQLGLAQPPQPNQKGGGKGKKGRPPSAHAAPKIKQKGDGRTTVTESN